MTSCRSCGQTIPLPKMTLQIGCRACGNEQGWSPGEGDQASASPQAATPEPGAEALADGAGAAPVSAEATPKLRPGPVRPPRPGPPTGAGPANNPDIAIVDQKRLRFRAWTPSTFSLSSKLIYVGMVLACIACMLAAVGGVVAAVANSRWIEEMILGAVFAVSFGMLGVCVLCIGRYLRMLARFQEELWKRGRALLLAARGEGDYTTPRPNVESFVAHGRVLAIFGMASAAWLGILGLVGCGFGLSESRWVEEFIFSFGVFFGGCVGGLFVFCLSAYCHQQVLGFLELVRDQDALLTELELGNESPA